MKTKVVLLLLVSVAVIRSYAQSTSEKTNIEHLTANSFKQKIFDYTKSNTWNYKGKLPAIIDFYADWCRPCKMIAPHLEDISNNYKGKLLVYKVNTDKERELAQVFGIQSIPAVLFIPLKGQPQMIIGAYPKEHYENLVKTFLNVK
jgi:thioredoxin